jgi:hypothetical protein
MSDVERQRLRILERAALVSYYATAAAIVTGAIVAGVVKHRVGLAVEIPVIMTFGFVGGLLTGAPMGSVAGLDAEMKIRDFQSQPLTKTQCVKEGMKIGVWKGSMLKQAGMGILAAYMLLRMGVNKMQGRSPERPDNRDTAADDKGREPEGPI